MPPLEEIEILSDILTDDPQSALCEDEGRAMMQLVSHFFDSLTLHDQHTYCPVTGMALEATGSHLPLTIPSPSFPQIFDVAPGASLAFHTGLGGEAATAAGIIALASQGADVIVDDFIFIFAPKYQDGLVARVVDDVIASSGIAYFSAAGNFGRGSSYEARYSPSVIDEVPFHSFLPGQQYLRFIMVNPGLVILEWDSPFGILEGSKNTTSDLDLFVTLAGDLTSVVAASSQANIELGVPRESIVIESENTLVELDLYIQEFDGERPNFVKVTFTSDVLVTEGPDIGGPYIFGHGNAEGAMAVAAAPFDSTPPFGVSPAVVGIFSSAGGQPILFDARGERLEKELLRDAP